ncbi:hypothetical protein HNP69_000142 [Chryseobacterium koreense]|nr:hypothetical protein [Chryseobacterium koreense]
MKDMKDLRRNLVYFFLKDFTNEILSTENRKINLN